MSDKIEIPFSKGKIVMLTLGAVAFVVIAIWMCLSPEMSAFRKVIAVVGILFFGWCAIIGLKKLFDQRPGLVVDEEGVVDHSSGISVGRIPWSDIVAIEETLMSGQKFVTILLHDPEAYLSKGGAIKAKINAANLQMTGSPINISANPLKLSHTELKQLLDDGFARYGNS